MVLKRGLPAGAPRCLAVERPERPDDYAAECDAPETTNYIGIALFTSFRGNCRIFQCNGSSACFCEYWAKPEARNDKSRHQDASQLGSGHFSLHGGRIATAA